MPIIFSTELFAPSVSFGALTLAGAGGISAPSGATSITDAGGTNLSLSGGVVSPATAGVTSGTVTFDNDATWNVNAVADEYSVINDAQALAASINAAPDGGKTIRFRSGTLTLGTSRIGNGQTYTAPIVVTGETGTVLTPGIDIGSANGLTLRGLEIHDPDGGVTNDLINIIGPARNIIIEDCKLHGKFLDPLGDYSAEGAYQNTRSALLNSNSDGFLNGLIIQRCEIYDVLSGATPTIEGADPFIIRDNLTYRTYTDPWGVTCLLGSYDAPKIFERNIYHTIVGDPADFDNPHIDMFQVQQTAANSGAILTGFRFEQNFMVETPGISRGREADFLASFGNVVIKDAIVRGNFAAITAVHGITFEVVDGGLYEGNTLIRPNSVEGDRIPSIRLGDQSAIGTITLSRNVVEDIFIGAGATTVETNNVVLGASGATIPYTDAFVGPDTVTTSLADALAKFAPKPLGPLDIDNSGTQTVGDVGAINSAFSVIGSPMDPSGWSITPV